MTAPIAMFPRQPTDRRREQINVFSWAEIEGIVELIAERASHCGIETIVGIARSGLVPAVMLSHRMEVRPLAVLDIARTHSDDINASKSAPRLRSLSHHDAVEGRRVLLVDDIVGGGLTMAAATRLLRDHHAEVMTATLVVNQCNLGASRPELVADIVGCVVHGWVVFPWEGKERPADA